MSDYDKYNEFVNRYRVQNIRVQRDYRNIDYYNTKASYYADREEIVEMEVPRRHFEHLVEVADLYTKMWQDERDERYMRKEYPAIKEAYEKYRMLLELYK